MTRERAHEGRLDAMGGVDHQDVLAVGVCDEGQGAVRREADRMRPGDDVAEGAAVSRGRAHGEPRQRVAPGVEERQRREHGVVEDERRGCGVSMPSIRWATHVSVGCRGGPRRRRSRGPARAPPSARLLRAIGERPRRRDGEGRDGERRDTRPEELRDVELRAIDAPAQAPRTPVHCDRRNHGERRRGEGDDRVVLRARDVRCRSVRRDDDAHRFGADVGVASDCAGRGVERVDVPVALPRHVEAGGAGAEGEGTRPDRDVEAAGSSDPPAARRLRGAPRAPARPRVHVDERDRVALRVDDVHRRLVGAERDARRVVRLPRHRQDRASLRIAAPHRRDGDHERDAERAAEAHGALVIWKVIELARAARQLGRGDLRDAVVLAVDGRHPRTRVEHVLRAPRLARERALGHLKAAARRSVGVQSLHALVRPDDELVAVAIVPPVEHQLVHAREPVEHLGREGVLPVLRGDELVDVAEHRLREREAHRACTTTVLDVSPATGR